VAIRLRLISSNGEDPPLVNKEFNFKTLTGGKKIKNTFAIDVFLMILELLRAPDRFSLRRALLYLLEA
jgi:hypothetical protein